MVVPINGSTVAADGPETCGDFRETWETLEVSDDFLAHLWIFSYFLSGMRSQDELFGSSWDDFLMWIGSGNSEFRM